MFKKLAANTGEIIDGAKDADSNEKIVRKAILVHSGENGSPVIFHSSDGEISFDEARIQSIVDAQNAMIEKLAQEYGGMDKMPIGAFPPILDQHANDSNDRIRGRLTGKLSFEKRDVPKVGKNVACAIGEITFLGENTVKQVKDGRIYHLSVGIGDDHESESYNTLGETSTVIEPAAAGAMLLSKKQVTNLTENVIKKGASKMADSKKRLEAQKAKLAKLTSLSESLTTLSAKLDSANKTVKLTKKQDTVRNSLVKLMKSGKMTPAEFKKQDIKKLAALPDEAISAIVEVFESREPVIDPVQKGTSEAIDFSEIGKGLEKKQMSRLAAEIKGDFKKLGAKVKMEEAEDQEHGKKFEMESAVDEKEKKMADDTQKDEKELACEGKKLMEADVKSEDQLKASEDIQAQIDELTTQMARLAGIVAELMEVEKAEGEQLEAEAEAHKDLEEQPEKEVEGEKKGLSEEEAKAKLEAAASDEDKKEKDGEKA